MKRSKTLTFILELPLAVDAGQPKRIHGHFEKARCLYNALRGEALKRLQRMRADPAWQAARAISKTQKQERQAAFSQLRQAYGFSEYALHDFAKEANCTWISDHIDSMMAQTLATRAYRAVNRVCLGQAKHVRFRSKRRGLDSVENKWERSGLRFELQAPEEGNQGWLIWGRDRLSALIDWKDPVVKHGLAHRIKYARLVRRKASSPQAQGADVEGYRYFAQLVLVGKPHRKSLHGRMVHEIVRRGNTIRTEKLSYKAWQKQYGKSVGHSAPGMLIDHLRRTVASTGGTLDEFPTHSTKLSQYCHGCQSYVKKPLSQRWHQCACGVGPVQRDLYSAWLAAHLEPANTIPSIAHDEWEGADLRLRAAIEVLQQRAKQGQVLPPNDGITHATRAAASFAMALNLIKAMEAPLHEV